MILETMCCALPLVLAVESAFSASAFERGSPSVEDALPRVVLQPPQRARGVARPRLITEKHRIGPLLAQFAEVVDGSSPVITLALVEEPGAAPGRDGMDAGGGTDRRVAVFTGPEPTLVGWLADVAVVDRLFSLRGDRRATWRSVIVAGQPVLLVCDTGKRVTSYALGADRLFVQSGFSVESAIEIHDLAVVRDTVLVLVRDTLGRATLIETQHDLLTSDRTLDGLGPEWLRSEGRTTAARMLVSEGDGEPGGRELIGIVSADIDGQALTTTLTTIGGQSRELRETLEAYESEEAACIALAVSTVEDGGYSIAVGVPHDRKYRGRVVLYQGSDGHLERLTALFDPITLDQQRREQSGLPRNRPDGIWSSDFGATVALLRSSEREWRVVAGAPSSPVYGGIYAYSVLSQERAWSVEAEANLSHGQHGTALETSRAHDGVLVGIDAAPEYLLTSAFSSSLSYVDFSGRRIWWFGVEKLSRILEGG